MVSLIMSWRSCIALDGLAGESIAGRTTCAEPIWCPMNPLNFRSRRFQMRRYNVSHGQLLLRSTKTLDLTTRVDILFKGVRAMKLNTDVPDLTIREPTDAEAKSIESECQGATLNGNQIYVLSSSAGQGYVISSSMQHNEDAGEYDDPSHLFSNL